MYQQSCINKIVSTKDKPREELRKYPYFGKSKISPKYIVLFQAPGTGMVVFNYDNEKSLWPLGNFDTSWIEKKFTVVENGTLTITL